MNYINVLRPNDAYMLENIHSGNRVMSGWCWALNGTNVYLFLLDAQE